MIQKATVTIEPLAPFDLALSSLVFADGGRSVRGFHGCCFSQVIDVGSRLVWAKLASDGCVNKPKLVLELYADGTGFSENEKQQAVKTVSHIFSLDLPLGAFYSHVQGDSVMAQVTQQLCGFKFPTTPMVFESLIDTIVEQQISIKVERSIEERLAIVFGESVVVGDEKFFAFPTVGALVDAGVERIRQVGLSLRKAEYIYGVVRLVVDGGLDLEDLKVCGSDEVVGVLDEIRGYRCLDGGVDNA